MSQAVLFFLTVGISLTKCISKVKIIILGSGRLVC